MGVTGTSSFPCCGKNDVDIVDIMERTSDQQQPQSHKDKEDEEEAPAAELPKLESLPEVQPNPGPVPQLEEMAIMMPSKPTPDAEGDYITESQEQQIYSIESLKPYKEELIERPWSFKTSSSSMEEELVCTSTHFRSIRVQTSKHLFWSNKLTQASELSFQKVKSPREKYVSISQVLTECAPRPLGSSRSCTSLPAALGLADLINFASSLAVASSSSMNMPNLENIIKGSSEKSQETSREFCQPGQSVKFSQTTQITQMSSEKQEKKPENMTTHKSWTPETRNVACSYINFSKTGLKNHTIQGEVKFVQAPTTSPQLQGAKEDSVPGTKKGNPLLLKILFKLSSPHPQRND
ncbi:spermatogenesis-associated protein 32 [Cricetulus griseus]|uniref:Spermatogenesis-associated protein 32 n=1 Tax=Cricetulus griseus TaxID=10029 RepID=A0A9J7JWA8_CRIGR|nr:spermatogenesis-associated protein 32 [Cricetulus griseus]XP_027283835.1 spermatogenesis-associated protein 32 [Cricetulus griseus]